MRPRRHTDRRLARPALQRVEIPTRVRHPRMRNHPAARMPAKRPRSRIRPALDGLPQDLDAVVEVVPFLVVDEARGAVDDAGVVPFGVEVLAQGAEAVEVVKGHDAHEVFFLVALDGRVEAEVGELFGYGAVDAHVVAVWGMGEVSCCVKAFCGCVNA